MRQTFDSSLDEMHVALLGLLRPHIGSGTSPSKVRQFLTSIRRRGRPCLRSCVIRVFGVVLSVSARTDRECRNPRRRPSSHDSLRIGRRRTHRFVFATQRQTNVTSHTFVYESRDQDGDLVVVRTRERIQSFLSALNKTTHH